MIIPIPSCTIFPSFPFGLRRTLPLSLSFSIGIRSNGSLISPIAIDEPIPPYPLRSKPCNQLGGSHRLQHARPRPSVGHDDKPRRCHYKCCNERRQMVGTALFLQVSAPHAFIPFAASARARHRGRDSHADVSVLSVENYCLSVATASRSCCSGQTDTKRSTRPCGTSGVRFLNSKLEFSNLRYIRISFG